MDDLVEFLKARLGEDQEDAERGYLKAPEIPDYDGWNNSTTVGLTPAVTVRVLAEVDAKRRIIEEIVPAMNGMDDRIDSEWGVGTMDPSEYESVALLRLLALPYAAHPDFRAEWATPAPTA
jgi:hypothetical protein